MFFVTSLYRGGYHTRGKCPGVIVWGGGSGPGHKRKLGQNIGGGHLVINSIKLLVRTTPARL